MSSGETFYNISCQADGTWTSSNFTCDGKYIFFVFVTFQCKISPALIYFVTYHYYVIHALFCVPTYVSLNSYFQLSDIDECSGGTDNCGNGDCVNVPGTFTCLEARLCQCNISGKLVI